jgi:tetratricopeptide (TPR) repeat protein
MAALSSLADQWVEKGRARHVKGDFPGALAKYEKAIKLNPNHAEALHLKGVVAIQNQDPRSAVALITQALTIAGERGNYLSNLAAALLALRMPERALHYIDRAIALGQISAEGATIRGEALASLGHLDRALLQFEALYLQWPNHREGLDGFINILMELGRFGVIKHLLLSHFKAHGADDALRLRLATALRHLNAHQAALDLLDHSQNKDDADWIVASFKSLLELGRGEESLVLGQRLLTKKDLIAAQYVNDPFVKEARKRIPLSLPLSKPLAYKSNVVCFSLWGAQEKYTFSAVLNAKLAPTIYPGWVARFYCDETVPSVILDALRDYGAEVVMIAKDPRPNLALLWRFIACDDPMVGYFVCRDCDSVINTREKAAVDEWIASGEPFHVMRDHPEHAELIMAGMWGGVAGLLPDLSKAAVDYYERHVNRNRWVDQDFLRDRVWPAIKNYCLVHDDFYAMGGDARRFPEGAVLPPGQHVGGYQPKQWVARG